MKYDGLQDLEVKIRALIVDPNSGSPVLVLKDINSEEMVPIWVGACEANAIASAIENISSPRPMTHDLLKNLVNQVNLIVKRVVITELKENTYFSTIEMVSISDEMVYLDARPSDAIALALRCASPIYVRREILSSSAKAFSDADSDEDELSLNKTGDDWPELLDDNNEGLPM